MSSKCKTCGLQHRADSTLLDPCRFCELNKPVKYNPPIINVKDYVSMTKRYVFQRCKVCRQNKYTFELKFLTRDREQFFLCPACDQQAVCHKCRKSHGRWKLQLGKIAGTEFDLFCDNCQQL